jgi:hypothetical protein
VRTEAPEAFHVRQGVASRGEKKPEEGRNLSSIMEGWLWLRGTEKDVGV